MKLTFADDVEQFRQEFLTWLAENRPSVEEMTADPPRSSAHVPGWAQAWTKRMFDSGWLVPGWPPERGGRNASPVQTLVYLEELTRAGVPRSTNPQGLGHIVPSILDWGTEAQIRDFAMPVLRGERTICLGMSEPGAGSDLASLSTRAVLDGDSFVVNGQKVWTSGASMADFCFLFCRTDPAAPKHKGISVLLIELDSPGVTVRPLPEIIDPDRPDLNEVFFTDLVVPAANLVGELNNGWALAGSHLAHERSTVWLRNVMTLDEEIRRLLAEAPDALRRLSAAERAIAADQIVECFIDAAAARCVGYRGFAKAVRGSSAPEQALMKMFSTEALRRLHLVAVEMLGGDVLTRTDDDPVATDGVDWLRGYFKAFRSTIAAGSSEIQRNIIAEKVLGLPRH